jgi:hypothetical protein
MDGARYLEDGRLTVFRRNGTYYARIRTTASEKYIVRSLKTTIEQAAVQAGRRLLFQIEQRADQGLPPKSKLFSTVIDDYIRFRERDHAHGKTSAGMLRQIARVSKFWREYAGQLAVEDIDDKVMREDPACGTADFLVGAKRVAEERHGSDISAHLYGVDTADMAVNLSVFNMILNGDGRSNITSGDSLEEIKKHEDKYTVALCNPPSVRESLKSGRRF